MNVAVPYVLAAILDVLGYRERLERDRQSGRLDFKDALQKAMQELSNVNEAQYAYTAISDTIIITAFDDANLVGLLQVLKKVQLSFLREGLLVRGGVAYERHFKSNNITYSHALALAHQIETEEAVYPRVVVDRNLIETQKIKNFWAKAAESHLVCECNGVYFINILDGGNWEQVYGWAKAIYDGERDLLLGKEREFLKHTWFENYILTSPHAKPAISFPGYLPRIKLTS